MPTEYTPEQTSLIMSKFRALFTHGETQKAFSLRDRLRAGEYIAPHEYDPNFVWPQKPVAIPGLKAPRRTGPGSSAQAWITFASQVSDIELEVLRAMSRDDIIQSLIERNVIPPEGK